MKAKIIYCNNIENIAFDLDDNSYTGDSMLYKIELPKYSKLIFSINILTNEVIFEIDNVTQDFTNMCIAYKKI